ncbi:DNA recombination protein RmuC [Microcella daejeonensis]|uniref:DNA recombination protein RmuC n=1 Tax=Microcella daejeonensis TaxID=2994971 RepID=A0A9E8MJB1_9MICO|nr:DNA recombination protein RmuC [Microcella daejeonensis]WAB80592.1 DNA recombination protein RmuC [Microcella daejeonensis]
MDFLLPLLIGLLVGGALGAVVALLLARRTGAAAEDPALIEARHQALLAQVRAEEQELRAQLVAEIAGLQATTSGLREQAALQDERYRELAERTRADQAAQAERERTETAARQAREGAESRVLQKLAPVQELLRTMQEKVTELEGQRSRQHGELSQQLRQAAEAEERLRATAESLASALRNNATRGVWGETQLKTLVESAGLLNRVDFLLQESIDADGAARRPDMVLRLPGGKAIAVDAKVPYNSYIEASAIPATATGEEEARRSGLLADHAKRVKAHVDALAAKNYWTGLDSSPEFTIAFIPNEPLLAAALEKDPALLEYAFGKRIALASPVSFWAVLKTVAFTWQQDVLTDEAKMLFDLSKELYARIAKLAEHADALGGTIERSVKAYNQFASSLESRVLVTARRLDSLDESKVVPVPRTIDEQPRQLTAAELTESMASSPASAPLDLDLPAASRPE